MSAMQLEQINKLKELERNTAETWHKYWMDYSSFDTWQFWVVLTLLVLPLVIFFIFLNRKDALLLGFFGYNFHVFFTYTDVIGANHSYWFYPYKVFPILPSSFTLDVSLVPVSYIFLFQWTLKHKKNYYVWMIPLSVFYAFIFKPIFVSLGLFELNRGMNYFYLFLLYLLVASLAKLMTDLFVYLQKRSKSA